jgi:hypothetical protein
MALMFLVTPSISKLSISNGLQRVIIEVRLGLIDKELMRILKR